MRGEESGLFKNWSVNSRENLGSYGQAGLLTSMVPRVVLRKPDKADILFYHANGLGYMRECVDAAWKTSLLDSGARIVYVHPAILGRCLLLLFKKLFKQSDPFWGRVTLRIIQEYSVILSISPKVVITFSDNNVRFNILCRLVTGPKFFAIQNGIRGPEIHKNPENFLLTNFFCFGEEVKKNFTEAGARIGKFIPIGSLRDGVYRRQVARERPLQKRYDICFVSQFRVARFRKGDKRELSGLRETTELLLAYVGRFCKENQKTFCIAGSAKDQEAEDEQNWLFSNPGIVDADFVMNQPSMFSSYRAIDQSSLILTVSSTIGFEALARGRRVLFCNFSGDSYYDLPWGYDQGLWAISDGSLSYEAFRTRVTKILSMSVEQWQIIVKQVGQYFMYFDENAYPQDKIRTTIRRQLSSSFQE